MKSVLGLGLILIVVAFFNRSDGRISSPEIFKSFTSELVEDPGIATGKYSRIILSLSFERSRFVVDGNAESVLYSKESSVHKLNNLEKGDPVTVWYSIEEEPQTHSFLNFVDASGLAIGDDVIVEPKQTQVKNNREFWWMLVIGMGLSVIGITGWVVRKSRSWNENKQK